MALPVYAGEIDTTWRAEDVLVAQAACASLDPIMKVATLLGEGRDADAAAVWNNAHQTDACKGFPGGIPVMLVEWVAGHFDTSQGLGSVWRAKDAYGFEVFILLDDRTGGHAARTQSSI